METPPALGRILHRRFGEGQLLALEHHQRLDLRVLQRETAAEDLERPTVDSDEAGGGIGDAPAEDRAQDQAEDHAAEAPQRLDLVAVLLQEARAGDHVEIALAHQLE